jgi:hypothetical protein
MPMKMTKNHGSLLIPRKEASHKAKSTLNIASLSHVGALQYDFQR